MKSLHKEAREGDIYTDNNETMEDNLDEIYDYCALILFESLLPFMILDCHEWFLNMRNWS